MSTMSGWRCSRSRLGLAPVFDVSICAAAAACAASATTQQLAAADFVPVFDSSEEDRLAKLCASLSNPQRMHFDVEVENCSWIY